MDTLFVFCGGSRTFLDCFDAAFENVITKLCPDLTKVSVLFYMKLTDPGPKNFRMKSYFYGNYINHNFFYKDNDYNKIMAKLDEYKEKGLEISQILLFNSEINDFDLMLQVKKRSMYKGFNSMDVHLIRALHQAFNYERCGQLLQEIETVRGSEFGTIVYIRPDLLFTGCAKPLSEYRRDKVTISVGDDGYSNDHFAIIPRRYAKNFFFDRMELYRTNETTVYNTPELVYYATIEHETQKIAEYHILREFWVEDEGLKKWTR